MICYGIATCYMCDVIYVIDVIDVIDVKYCNVDVKNWSHPVVYM